MASELVPCPRCKEFRVSLNKSGAMCNLCSYTPGKVTPVVAIEYALLDIDVDTGFDAAKELRNRHAQ